MSKKYEIYTLSAIALFGLLLKIFINKKASFDGLQGPADATIYGYTITLLSTILLLMYIYWLSSEKKMGEAGLVSVIKMISNSIPVLIFISVLIWSIIINIKFKTKINKGNVSNDYDKFQFISTILIIFQFLIIIKYIINSSIGNEIKNTSMTYNEQLNKLIDLFSKTLPTFSYLFAVINYIILGITHVSLEFFTTDG